MRARRPDRRGAIARNAARLRARRRRARLCAVVKADGYGHGAVAAARAALAGGATWLAVATARGGRASCARRASTRRSLVMGALTPRSCRSRWTPAPTSSRGREGSSPRCRRRQRACTSSSTPAWAGSARATRAGDAGRRGRAAPDAARRPDDALRHRRRARRRRSSTSSSRASAPGPSRCASATRARSCTPPTAPATLRDPATHFDMVRCGVAIYGMDPFGEDPFAHELEPALTLRS